LLDQLYLADVTIIGNSIGGWIAAEMGLLAPPRVTGVILVDAVGIQVPGHPIADFFSLSMDQVFQLSFHNPGPFRIDPSSLPPATQAAMAGNRTALATYAGTAMSDPSLLQRLSEMQTATWVLWGESDRIVDSAYGRAFAAAMPKAHFELLPATGHMPQMETPDSLLRAILDCVDVDSSKPDIAVQGLGESVTSR
jgi:pimeloyl-ACP methyl ester carboxylesterase